MNNTYKNSHRNRFGGYFYKKKKLATEIESIAVIKKNI